MDKQFLNIEIFHDGKGEELFIHNLTTGKVIQFTPGLYYFISQQYYTIKERYTEAFYMLCDTYPKYQSNHKYLVVRRFFRCNFFIHDNIPDIDNDGNYHIECVPCPLKGWDCNGQNVICNPKLNTTLSERELEVARELIYTDNNKIKVADKLFISTHTVENHRRNIYAKLQLSGRNAFSQLYQYMNANKLIK
jgi:DNA-binding CsgD family transcriptional regulator